METIQLSRYKEDVIAISQLHHLDDALDIIAFLQAEDFVSDQLQKNHNKTCINAKIIAKRISSHAKLADHYATLSLQSAPEISFLPGYYCILNLLKIHSLAGPYSNEFNHHSRWHGATYDTQGKSSQSLMTKEVRVRCGGAIALFYKSLTGAEITSNRILKLRDIYPFVSGISSEVLLVMGRLNESWVIMFRAENISGTVTVEVDVLRWEGGKTEIPYKGNVRYIPCLKGFRKKPKSEKTFFKSVTATPGLTLEEEVRQMVCTEYLWLQERGKMTVCYQQKPSFPLPEEFASALAFFHLSSICRYNPEFIEKLTKSKFWPMLLAMRRHTLFHFLVSTWSYIIRKNYIPGPYQMSERGHR